MTTLLRDVAKKAVENNNYGGNITETGKFVSYSTFSCSCHRDTAFQMQSCLGKNRMVRERLK